MNENKGLGNRTSKYKKRGEKKAPTTKTYNTQRNTTKQNLCMMYWLLVTARCPSKFMFSQHCGWISGLTQYSTSSFQGYRIFLNQWKTLFGLTFFTGYNNSMEELNFIRAIQNAISQYLGIISKH